MGIFRLSDWDKGCAGIFGFLFGHKLVPQYDEKIQNMPEEVRDVIHRCKSTDGVTAIVDSYRAKTWRGDVCVRCGQIRDFPHPAIPLPERDK